MDLTVALMVFGGVAFFLAIGFGIALFRARLRLAGTPTGDYDLLIGCTSVEEDMVMVTENMDDFKNIQALGLKTGLTGRRGNIERTKFTVPVCAFPEEALPSYWSPPI